MAGRAVCKNCWRPRRNPSRSATGSFVPRRSRFSSAPARFCRAVARFVQYLAQWTRFRPACFSGFERSSGDRLAPARDRLPRSRARCPTTRWLALWITSDIGGRPRSRTDNIRRIVRRIEKDKRRRIFFSPFEINMLERKIPRTRDLYSLSHPVFCGFSGRFLPFPAGRWLF